ncbi:MAG: hypothetical protein ABI876_00790 [Bacteroidota bacterium]
MKRAYDHRRTIKRLLHRGAMPAVALLLGLGGGRLAAQDLEGIGEKQAVTVAGSVSGRGVAYAADGIARRRSPFSYSLSGSVDLNIYDLDLPFSFTLSEQDRSLSQPFNQFGVSPHYKWITAHLGYRNLTFSPYTLAGYQMLGGGIELNPGDFRLGFIAGRLNRAVEEDTTRPSVAPAYQRNGFSGRIGYGSEANHIDLIMLKAADDAGSLQTVPIASDLRPAENLVLGASGRATLVQGLSIYGDFAVSDYTRDTRSDKLNAADVEIISDAIPPRTSTQICMALTAGLSFNIGTFNLGAIYSRIDPDYKSMGAYYLSGDLESVTLTPAIALLENTLYLNGSLGFQHDNIQGKKRATTQRIAPMLTASYSPAGPFGLTLQASDLLTSQRAGSVPLNDTIRMAQRNPTLVISPRYSIDDSTIAHSFQGSLSYQGLLDGNAFTAEYSEYTSLGADISYTLSLPPADASITASVNRNSLANVGGTYGSTGFSLAGSKGLAGKKVSLNGSLGLSLFPAGNTLNAGAGGLWRPDGHQTINLSLSMTTSSASDAVRRSIHEYITVLSYAYTF